MIPIHELLSRVRWDKAFGQGDFEIGFVDRFESGIQRVALGEVTFPGTDGRSFQFVDAAGQVRRVPFHRIRQVYRDGVLIWHRPAGSAPQA